MRWDRRDPRSKQLLERILTDKMEQIGRGLWLPMEYHIQFFQSGQGTNSNLLRENRIHILRCVLNDDVPESTFIPVHRPGSLNYVNNDQFIQTLPAGEDLLDYIVNFMVKYAHLPTKPILPGYPYKWFLVGLAAGLVGGLFILPIRKGNFKNIDKSDPHSVPFHQPQTKT